MSTAKRADVGARVEHAFTAGWRGKVVQVSRRYDGAWCTVLWDDGTRSEHHVSVLLLASRGSRADTAAPAGPGST